jgi:hypothetical protein
MSVVGEVEMPLPDHKGTPAGFLLLDSVFHRLLTTWPEPRPTDYDLMVAAEAATGAGELAAMRRDFDFKWADRPYMAHIRANVSGTDVQRTFAFSICAPLLARVGVPPGTERGPSSRLAFGPQSFRWSMTVSELGAQLPVLAWWTASFFEGYLAPAPTAVEIEVAGDCQDAEFRFVSGPVCLTVTFAPQF